MTLKFPRWRSRVFLLLAGWLFACHQVGEAEKLVASAEEARHEGQLELAADLYHRAAELQPEDVAIHYRAALLDVQAQKMREAEGHLRKVLSRRPDFASEHGTAVGKSGSHPLILTILWICCAE